MKINSNSPSVLELLPFFSRTNGGIFGGWAGELWFSSHRGGSSFCWVIKSPQIDVPQNTTDSEQRGPIPCWGVPADFFSPLKIFKKPNLISSPAIKFAIKIPNNGAADFTVVCGAPGPPSFASAKMFKCHSHICWKRLLPVTF